jgi:ribonuclease E
MPNAQTTVGGEADGERQGGRRRNRRGGRGRDRDDTNGAGTNGHAAPIDANTPPAPREAANEGFEARSFEGPADDAEATTATAGPATDARSEESGSRRRRGGRGRDRAPREGVPEGDMNGAAPSHAPLGEPAREAFAAPLPASDHGAEVTSPVESAQPANTVFVTEPQQDPQSPAEPPVAVPIAAPSEAAAAAQEDYVLPVGSLVAVAEGACLQWVNSDADKIRAAQEAMAAAPAPIHVPREIRKLERVDEGPLVLVETKKDLSQVRLPFETQAPGA